MLDKNGELIEDRIYNLKDMDRTLVIETRTQLVAQKVTEFLKASDPFQKTIVFCDDINHAERMRQALVNLNPERVAENRKYVMRITGDDQEGKAELDNFINPEERYPVIATTSKLMTTGVDAQTCKLIVLDQHIKSMTEFKQIIGRGTRINEDFGKYWFTIMDFKKATELLPTQLSTETQWWSTPPKATSYQSRPTIYLKAMASAQGVMEKAMIWILPARKTARSSSNTSSTASRSMSSPSVSSTTGRMAD